MKNHAFRSSLLLLCAGSLMPWACAGDERPTDSGHHAPVENPDDKKGGPTTGDAANRGEWSLMPAWHKGSNLSQVGYLLNPAGQTLSVSGRVLAVALAQKGRYLIAKTDRGVAVIDAATFIVSSQSDLPTKDDGGTMYGLTVAADDATIYLTSKKSRLISAHVDEKGTLAFGTSIDLANDKKASDPLGIALSADGRTAYVALAISNAVAIVDLAAGKVTATIPAGVCPYAVALTHDAKTLFVSNFGGSLARPGDQTELSAGTPVAVDARSVALRGTVSVINTVTGKVTQEIPTGIHPEAMVMSPNGQRLYVVDSSGDGVCEIDTVRCQKLRTLNTKPRADLPFGSLSTGIAISDDGNRLFTANAGNNAVAVIALRGDAQAPIAFIPAGGYPGSVALHGDALYIGNVLGFKGDLQKVTLPKDEAAFTPMTAMAEKSFHLAEILRAQARADAGDRAPLRPVPARIGDPSPIRHVVYIIKENKKFDQVLGDIGRGNCDPKLVEFPRQTTPNIHALADEFVLLDNYYCNGVLSCDGHQHATQGLSSPYREKDWANTRCTYDFGIDPLCYAGCGFIWDQVLRQGLSFQNFGEMDYSVTPKGRKWTDYFAAWKKRETCDFTLDYRIETLRRYSDPGYPGWSMAIPDQVRADVFIRTLATWEKSGQMPSLTIIYLPNDHTQHGSQGWPTPRAYVADNDLATGRVVAALSKSPFWKDMAIFINEDDPQTGTDHVDGHRSYCLVAGPYVKRGGQVISRFYNQSSVLHTIDRILGLPPLNQTVAAAPLMDECFQDIPDPRPYACRPAEVSIDELNPDPQKTASKVQAELAPLTEKLDFSAPDRLDADAEMFSRWVWSTVHGDERFPIEFMGAHGKGLPALGLQLDAQEKDTDDDENEDGDA